MHWWPKLYLEVLLVITINIYIFEATLMDFLIFIGLNGIIKIENGILSLFTRTIIFHPDITSRQRKILGGQFLTL